MIEDLKSREPKSSKKPSKGEVHLIQLINKLESRLEAIDQELNVSLYQVAERRLQLSAIELHRPSWSPFYMN